MLGKIGADTTLCTSAQLIVNAFVSGAETYTWSTGQTTPSISVSSSGLYTVTVRAEQACFLLSDSIRVAVKEFPQAQILTDIGQYCETGTIALQSLAEPEVTIRWSTGDTSNLLTVKDAGFYTLTTENACGTASDSITISIPECPGDCEFYLANIFTPNNDGLNDDFGPFGATCLALLDFNFRIYDRWGGLIFETRQPDGRWNGTENGGKPASSDVYAWQFEFKTERLGAVRRSGDVTLLR